MRISYWSSDVCSSDLAFPLPPRSVLFRRKRPRRERSTSLHTGRDKGRHWPHRLPDRLACDEMRGLTCANEPIIEIGRASCRERVCQYVKISVIAVSLKKKKP